VIVSADFAGRRWSWSGRVVRVESEIDQLTRMLHLVARVEAPFADDGSGRPPLAAGLFVEAVIHGRRRQGLVVLPRAALRDGGHVLVVDADERLRRRAVDVLRLERGRVVLADGVRPGERVVVSLLEAATDGMRVRPAEADAGSP
jgi:multidrug efflux pump subunit AcrA (membrane-fusion protein)